MLNEGTNEWIKKVSINKCENKCLFDELRISE